MLPVAGGVLRGSCPGRALGAVPVQSSAPAEHGEGPFLGFKAQVRPGVLEMGLVGSCSGW